MTSRTMVPALPMLALLVCSAAAQTNPAPSAPPAGGSATPATTTSLPAVPTSSTAAVASPSVAPATPSATPATAQRQGASPQDIAQVREDVRELREDVLAQIAGLRQTWWERLIPAGIGLLGVAVGGLLGWLQQGRQLRLSAELQKQQLQENERIGQAKAGYESLSKVIDYQTRQVNEFYSPLRLMLQRSGGVRRQLCDQLRQKVPTRFQMRPQSDGREHLYVVEADGREEPFRLIQHMYELITKHAELFPLVEEIVNIGMTMTELINTKGGLAISGSEQVNAGLGRYLAHFSILRDVARKAKASPALLASLQYNVSYPRELDAALDADIAVLAKEIDAWKALSRTMWEQAGRNASVVAPD